MNDYISREAVNDLIKAECSPKVAAYLIDAVATISAADVRPVVRGKWIDDKVSFYLGCSECGCFLEYAVDTFLDYGDHYNFCPNCGADMREES